MVRNHKEHGWFESSAYSYENLLEYPEVQLFSQSYPESSRSGYMYALQFFFDINNLNPTEALKLEDNEVKKTIMKAVMKKQESGAHASGRRIYYSIKRFYELHNREIRFNRSQRKALMKWRPKKIAKQHIPSKSDIYRAVDSVPKKDAVQQSRARSIILSLWQSGVRPSCLCSWRYGMFKGKLDRDIITIKVVANRTKGVYDVAVDTKLSGYKLPYYYTFINREAVQALREYIEARKKFDKWEPKDSDYIYVTTGTVSRGKRLNTKHLNAIIKTVFGQIGIDTESVWTHTLRKSFRKTMYKSGTDTDIAESMMGHKLSGSRSAYFDFTDKDFLQQQYQTVNWARYPIKQLEEEVTKLQQNGKSKDQQIEELQEKIKYLESPKFLQDLMNNIAESGSKFEVIEKPTKVLTKVIDIGDKESWQRLSKEGYFLVSSDDEHFVMQKEEE